MGIVFGAIVPHAFTVIPEMSTDFAEMATTRTAMEEIQRRAAEAKPDVVVIVGPHGFRVDGTICVADTGRGAGTLNWEGKQVEMNVPIDGALTDAIVVEATSKGIPIARGGYAGTRRTQAVMPIDWGVITPLWYFGHNRNVVGYGNVLAEAPRGPEGPPVVIATPSRSLPRESLIEFGRAVTDAATADGRRVAFVASCDWGHRHSESGPYGFSEASARVDKIMVDAVKGGDLRDMLVVSDEEATEAAIDGLWQAIMLAGVMDRVPMNVEFLGYEAPTYFGMIVAAFEPKS